MQYYFLFVYQSRQLQMHLFMQWRKTIISRVWVIQSISDVPFRKRYSKCTVFCLLTVKELWADLLSCWHLHLVTLILSIRIAASDWILNISTYALKAPDKAGSTCDSVADTMFKARELHLEILRLTSCVQNNKLLANEIKAWLWQG